MIERVKELVEAGVVLSRAGDREGAQRLVEEALRLDPLNPSAQEMLAELTGRPVATATPFAPPPADLFANLPPATGSNPFAKPAPRPPAGPPPISPPTIPGGMQAVRPEPSGPGPMREPSIHPTTLPAGHAMVRPKTGPPPPPLPEAELEVDLSEEEESGATLDPMNLIESPRPPTRPPPPPAADDPSLALLQKARDLVAFADHSGALGVLDTLLATQPGHPEATRLRSACEGTLVSMYESKLGELGRKPNLKLRADEVIWLNLDHRAGFVLAQIDGTVTLEDLFALSGMGRLDTARILAQLMEEKVIGV